MSDQQDRHGIIGDPKGVRWECPCGGRFSSEAEIRAHLADVGYAADGYPMSDQQAQELPGRGEHRIAESEANGRAGARLLRARGSSWEAFDALGLGWDHDDVYDYLNGTGTFQALSEQHRWRVAGMMMAFGIVAVEQARSEQVERPDEGRVVAAAELLYDNRVGWDEGRAPTAGRAFWAALGMALGRDMAWLAETDPDPGNAEGERQAALSLLGDCESDAAARLPKRPDEGAR